MSRFINSPCLLLSIAFAAAFLTGPTPALAQDSEADLRRQNQQLAAQAADLQKQLDEANERQRQLEARIADLEAKLAAALKSGSSTPPPPKSSGSAPALDPEEITVDESVPDASPRALFKAIIASYEEATAGLEIGRFIQSSSSGGGPDRDRRNYLKKLEAWRTAVNREFRAPIKWHVRVIDARVGPENRRLITVVAVDPKTDVRLGNTFDVVLNQNLVDRLARYESRGDMGPLIMRGTLVPQVRINSNRDVRGSFDNPPFIGPFAEFLFKVDVTSLIQPREEPAESTPAGEKEAASTPP